MNSLNQGGKEREEVTRIVSLVRIGPADPVGVVDVLVGPIRWKRIEKADGSSAKARP